jgi:hypothetical protein
MKSGSVGFGCVAVEDVLTGRASGGKWGFFAIPYTGGSAKTSEEVRRLPELPTSLHQRLLRFWMSLSFFLFCAFIASFCRLRLEYTLRLRVMSHRFMRLMNLT